MSTAREAAPELGVALTCRSLGLPRASYYRYGRPRAASLRSPRPKPPRALDATEERAVLDILHEERFLDQAPAEVYATLLEEGKFHCSVRTMYRMLAKYGEVRERRDQLRHPRYAKPELLATRPNQLWSWDITKLRGPAKWTCFYLYVLLDIFSRYVVGWMVAEAESARLAVSLFEETAVRQGVTPGTVTVHADRGAAMRSRPLNEKLIELGMGRSFSRPRVSNDNPFSESNFKTLKYRPDFPERFGSLIDAREHLGRFFTWYNEVHRHSGIGYLTPADVHMGRAAEVLERRQRVLYQAFEAHPDRFSGRGPRTLSLPPEVWINQPTEAVAVATAGH